MKLSIKAMAWTAGVLWAACLFATGILNLIFPSYGVAFLDLMKSLYPGYARLSGFGGVVVGTLYALLDGAVCGAVFGWLYNVFARSKAPVSITPPSA